MTGPEGNDEFCFRESPRETKFTVPQGTSHYVICYIAEQNKSKKFENRAEIPALTCNNGQHFAGNSELFSV